MSIEETIKEIGDKISEVSGNTLSFVSGKIGTESTQFQTKLLTLIFLVAILFIGFKIGHKTTKYVLIIASIIFIVSIIFSLF